MKIDALLREVESRGRTCLCPPDSGCDEADLAHAAAAVRAELAPKPVPDGELLPCPLTKKSWQAMWERCTRTKHRHWKDYGGRGIKVCERWESLENFIADVGRRPSATHSIDRIDNDGNYEPGNVRWATRVEQHRNKRTNHLLTFNGETLPISEWAERTGLGKTTIRQRIHRGWPVADALSTTRATNGWERMDGIKRAEQLGKMHRGRYGDVR